MNIKLDLNEAIETTGRNLGCLAILLAVTVVSGVVTVRMIELVERLLNILFWC